MLLQGRFFFILSVFSFRYVTPNTVKVIHKLLRSMFTQAEKWELVDKNPTHFATVPKSESQEREICVSRRTPLPFG